MLFLLIGWYSLFWSCGMPYLLFGTLLDLPPPDGFPVVEGHPPPLP